MPDSYFPFGVGNFDANIVLETDVGRGIEENTTVGNFDNGSEQGVEDG